MSSNRKNENQWTAARSERLPRARRSKLCSQKKNQKSIINFDFDYEVIKSISNYKKIKSILKSIIIDFCRVFY